MSTAAPGDEAPLSLPQARTVDGRAGLPADIRVTDLDVELLAVLGARAAGGPRAEAPSEGETEQERLQRADRDKKAQIERQQAAKALHDAVAVRVSNAYKKGRASAVSEEDRRATAFRGYALVGLLAAIVSMPLLAILVGIEPQAFGAYIAPVTGIAGTVVGYWFGSGGGQRPQN